MHLSYEYWNTMHMWHFHETHYYFLRWLQEFPKIYPHINCGIKYQKVQYTNKVEHSNPFNIWNLHSHTSWWKFAIGKRKTLPFLFELIPGKSCTGGLYGPWPQGVLFSSYVGGDLSMLFCYLIVSLMIVLYLDSTLGGNTTVKQQHLHLSFINMNNPLFVVVVCRCWPGWMRWCLTLTSPPSASTCSGASTITFILSSRQNNSNYESLHAHSANLMCPQADGGLPSQVPRVQTQVLQGWRMNPVTCTSSVSKSLSWPWCGAA